MYNFKKNTIGAKLNEIIKGMDCEPDYEMFLNNVKEMKDDIRPFLNTKLQENMVKMTNPYSGISMNVPRWIKDCRDYCVFMESYLKDCLEFRCDIYNAICEYSRDIYFLFFD